MKILYITPKINNEGGVARVLSVKTNYLIENLGYNIGIITQNDGNSNPFFNFNATISKFDISLDRKKIQFIFDYKKQVEQVIASFQPDVIVVCDNGIKGFLFSKIIKTKIPVVFEIHGSKFNEVTNFSRNFLNKITRNLKYRFKNYCVSKFKYVVALSKESASEWNIENSIIIPNPIDVTNGILSNLTSKKAIVVSRNSYEKGVDRLLPIWKKVTEIHPDWILEIYGIHSNDKQLSEMISSLELSSNVILHQPTKNIQEKYVQSSMYLMTSRTEGFPMVLLEAMNFGLPCIAYDCPIGPRAVIQNNENGFLVEDGNIAAFAEKIMALINDSELRKLLGNNAKTSVLKYNIDAIMLQWKTLFESIKTTV